MGKKCKVEGCENESACNHCDKCQKHHDEEVAGEDAYYGIKNIAEV